MGQPGSGGWMVVNNEMDEVKKNWESFDRSSFATDKVSWRAFYTTPSAWPILGTVLGLFILKNSGWPLDRLLHIIASHLTCEWQGDEFKIEILRET